VTKGYYTVDATMKKNEKERLIDDYNREIHSLRFSITTRCNLNCIYCHAEGEKKDSTQKKVFISAELVTAIARVASVHFNINRIKFSGGEPLLRDDLADIVHGIKEFEGDISVTTNGTLLSKYAADLADAGLNRVNVSLDTINEERYNFITASSGYLPKVIDGIYTAIDAGLTPLKLNTVLLKGLNEDGLTDLIDFVRACNRRSGRAAVILQLIELIPSFTQSAPTYKAEFQRVEAELAARASAIKTRRLQHRKKYFVDDVEVEVVHPIDNTEFCANCSRLRITSEGQIKPCLLRHDNLVPIESEDEEHILTRLKLAMQYREPFFQSSF